MKIKYSPIVIQILVILLCGCGEETTRDSTYEHHEWSELYKRNKGWFGGDGIFAIPLDGKEFIPATEETKTLLTFGDTMIGEHSGDTLLGENFTMVNNSIGLLHGKQPISDNISFHWAKSDTSDAALFVPNTPNSKPGDYYWLGDGFVNTEADSTLYIFAYLIQEKDTTGTGGFAFEQIGVSLIAIPSSSYPPYADHIQLETPLFDQSAQTTFGSSVFVNTAAAGAPNPDGYIYVYAVSTPNKVKGLLVARVLPEHFVDFEHWTYWDGSKWSDDMSKAVFIAEHVSNEMSVSPLPDGRIVLTYHYLTMSQEVAIQVGESLTGPFGDRNTVYDTSNDPSTVNYFTYNAKAFPHLSSNDSLLIGYNVNSLNFWSDILSEPNLYRPRFIQIPLNILK